MKRIVQIFLCYPKRRYLQSASVYVAKNVIKSRGVDSVKVDRGGIRFREASEEESTEVFATRSENHTMNWELCGTNNKSDVTVILIVEESRYMSSNLRRVINTQVTILIGIGHLSEIQIIIIKKGNKFN